MLLRELVPHDPQSCIRRGVRERYAIRRRGRDSGDVASAVIRRANAGQQAPGELRFAGTIRWRCREKQTFYLAHPPPGLRLGSKYSFVESSLKVRLDLLKSSLCHTKQCRRMEPVVQESRPSEKNVVNPAGDPVLGGCMRLGVKFLGQHAKQIVPIPGRGSEAIDQVLADAFSPDLDLPKVSRNSVAARGVSGSAAQVLA